MGKVKQNLDCNKCKNQILECNCHYQGPQYDIYADKADMLTAEEVQLREAQLATLNEPPELGAGNPFELLANALEQPPF